MSCESFKIIEPDGTEYYLGDYGFYIGKTASGLPDQDFLPSPNNTTIDGISRFNGEIFQHQTVQPRLITLPLFYTTENGNGFEANRNEVKKILFTRIPKKLVFDRVPYKYINVTISNNVNESYIYRDVNEFEGFFTVEYIAYDPFYYSFFSSTSFPSYLEDLGSDPSFVQLYYNTGMPYVEDVFNSLSNVVDAENFTINNYGSYDSKLKITIIGTVTNLTITNTTTNKSFTINNMSSETIIVNGTLGKVTDENGDLQTDKFSDGSDFIKLISGNNDFTLTGDFLNLTSITFDYKYTYL